MKSSILIIYTGGTIGMKQDPVEGTLKPFDFHQILEEVPELGKFALRVDSYTFDPLIDSSDVEPGLWIALARLIQERYDRYDGFVVLHGTDTMAYSAATLSFMLGDLAKPVIFTGSQLPIGTPRTDGDAFDSPDCPPLAVAGINIRYNRTLIRKPTSWDLPLRVQDRLDTRVSILRLHPGITPQVARNIACGPETRAVILETYGAGNAPSKPWLTDIIREADRMGKVLVNVSQCKKGTVNMDLYATGRALKDAGVVSGFDATTEAALGKLFALMGVSDDNAWVKKQFQEDLRGEISK